jgi:putative tributyrin esterase
MAPTKPAAGIRTIAVSDPQFECSSVRFLTIYSPALGGRADVSVFLSPGVELLSSVPVVVLLHGVYDSHWAWFFKGGAHEVTSDLIAKSRIRPMLIVAPSDGLYQDGSAYLRHSGRDYERWITEDVTEAVTRTFPCVDPGSPLFISGLSMGGYGALRLGAKYANLFRGVSAHSAITCIQEMSQFAFEEFPSDEIDAFDADILPWIEKNRNVLPPLRLDCGTSDPLIDSNRRFHQELDARGIPHRYAEFDGEHDWAYWHDHFGESLLFFEEILRGVPPSSTVQMKSRN